jgi:hypothetical protein
MSIHYPLAGAIDSTDAGAWDGLLGWGLGMRKAINIAWLAAAFASSNAALADFIYPIPDVETCKSLINTHAQPPQMIS